MKNFKYDEFDEALVAHICAGLNTLDKLVGQASNLRLLAEPHRRRNPWRTKTPVALIIEHRLEVLRNEGKINWNGRTCHVCSEPCTYLDTDPPSA